MLICKNCMNVSLLIKRNKKFWNETDLKKNRLTLHVGRDLHPGGENQPANFQVPLPSNPFWKFPFPAQPGPDDAARAHSHIIIIRGGTEAASWLSLSGLLLSGRLGGDLKKRSFPQPKRTGFCSRTLQDARWPVCVCVCFWWASQANQSICRSGLCRLNFESSSWIGWMLGWLKIDHFTIHYMVIVLVLNRARTWGSSFVDWALQVVLNSWNHLSRTLWSD